MLKVAIGGYDYEEFELNSVEECASDEHEILFYDYTEVITFEDDGRYIVGGCFDYEGCVLSSIRNFNTQEEADEYGKTLNYDYYDVVKL